ncbi:hydrogenase maturation nickel metallochaperone HypA [Candidatus Cloacimonadota bacterium]
MHEGAIVRSLFEIAEKIKQDEDLVKITKIKIVVGKFHQIVDEVMQMNFNIQKQEFAGFETAELEIIEKEVAVKCKNCGEISKLTEPVFYCIKCSSPDTEFISGNELYIENMEGFTD